MTHPVPHDLVVGFTPPYLLAGRGIPIPNTGLDIVILNISLKEKYIIAQGFALGKQKCLKQIP